MPPSWLGGETLAIISSHQSLAIPRSSEQLLAPPHELSTLGRNVATLESPPTQFPAALLMIKRICRPRVGRFCHVDFPVCREQN